MYVLYFEKKKFKTKIIIYFNHMKQLMIMKFNVILVIIS